MNGEGGVNAGGIDGSGDGVDKAWETRRRCKDKEQDVAMHKGDTHPPVSCARQRTGCVTKGCSPGPSDGRLASSGWGQEGRHGQDSGGRSVLAAWHLVAADKRVKRMGSQGDKMREEQKEEVRGRWTATWRSAGAGSSLGTGGAAWDGATTRLYLISRGRDQITRMSKASMPDVSGSGALRDLEIARGR